MPLYMRCIKQDETAFGNVDFHRELFAENWGCRAQIKKGEYNAHWRITLTLSSANTSNMLSLGQCRQVTG